MENHRENLAERLADLLRAGEPGENDFIALRKSVEQISERLFRIEKNLLSGNAQTASGNSKSFHASQEKFQLAEAVAPERQNGAALEIEKPCPYEPTGKPCDYCSMCSSLGF